MSAEENDGENYTQDEENLQFNQSYDETVFKKCLTLDCDNSLAVHSRRFNKTYVYSDNAIRVLDQPEISFKIPKINGLFLNADSEHLAVIVENKILIISSRKLEVLTEVESSDTFNYFTIQWSPVDPACFMATTENGHLLSYKFDATTKKIQTLKGAPGTFSCISWSKKGKQVAIGYSDKVGFEQFSPNDLVSKRKTVMKDCEYTFTRNIQWVDNYEFIIGASDTEIEQPGLYVAIQPGKNMQAESRFVHFEDPCYGMSNTRKPSFLFEFIPLWEMVIVGSHTSTDVAIFHRKKNLEKYPDGKTQEWWSLTLDESCRVTVTCNEEDEEEDEHPASPVGIQVCYADMSLMMVSTSGRVTKWKIVEKLGKPDAKVSIPRNDQITVGVGAEYKCENKKVVETVEPSKNSGFSFGQQAPAPGLTSTKQPLARTVSNISNNSNSSQLFANTTVSSPKSVVPTFTKQTTISENQVPKQDVFNQTIAPPSNFSFSKPTEPTKNIVKPKVIQTPTIQAKVEPQRQLIPPPSPVPQPVLPKIDEKQLLESIAITMNEFDKELGSFLQDCNRDYMDAEKSIKDINEDIKQLSIANKNLQNNVSDVSSEVNGYHSHCVDTMMRVDIDKENLLRKQHRDRSLSSPTTANMLRPMDNSLLNTIKNIRQWSSYIRSNTNECKHSLQKATMNKMKMGRSQSKVQTGPNRHVLYKINQVLVNNANVIDFESERVKKIEKDWRQMKIKVKRSKYFTNDHANLSIKDPSSNIIDEISDTGLMNLLSVLPNTEETRNLENKTPSKDRTPKLVATEPGSATFSVRRLSKKMMSDEKRKSTPLRKVASSFIDIDNKIGAKLDFDESIGNVGSSSFRNEINVPSKVLEESPVKMFGENQKSVISWAPAGTPVKKKVQTPNKSKTLNPDKILEQAPKFVVNATTLGHTIPASTPLKLNQFQTPTINKPETPKLNFSAIPSNMTQLGFSTPNANKPVLSFSTPKTSEGIVGGFTAPSIPETPKETPLLRTLPKIKEMTTQNTLRTDDEISEPSKFDFTTPKIIGGDPVLDKMKVITPQIGKSRKIPVENPAKSIKTPEDPKKSASGFSFGALTEKPEDKASGFSFGKAVDTKASSGFSFGKIDEKKPEEKNENKKSSFSFGTDKTETAGFSFGAIGSEKKSETKSDDKKEDKTEVKSKSDAFGSVGGFSFGGLGSSTPANATPSNIFASVGMAGETDNKTLNKQPSSVPSESFRTDSALVGASIFGKASDNVAPVNNTPNFPPPATNTSAFGNTSANNTSAFGNNSTNNTSVFGNTSAVANTSAFGNTSTFGSVPAGDNKANSSAFGSSNAFGSNNTFGGSGGAFGGSGGAFGGSGSAFGGSGGAFGGSGGAFGGTPAVAASNSQQSTFGSGATFGSAKTSGGGSSGFGALAAAGSSGNTGGGFGALAGGSTGGFGALAAGNTGNSGGFSFGNNGNNNGNTNGNNNGNNNSGGFGSSGGFAFGNNNNSSNPGFKF